MSDELELKNIDEYGVFLTETLSEWSIDQRLALAAAVAESWMPEYEKFSEQEDWGDPATLRQALNAAWNQLSGTLLARKDVARYEEQVDDITPHMDDFDCVEAITACAAVSETLQTCADLENSLARVANLMLNVVEYLVEEWPMEPAAQSRVWRQAVIRNEVQAQLKLVERIRVTKSLDDAGIRTLRDFARDLKATVLKKPKDVPPAGLTNQAAFEQYRRYVESDLQGKSDRDFCMEADSFMFGMMYLSDWSGRYSRREQTLDGSYGRLADQAGVRAVVARNAAIDAAVTEVPAWDGDLRLAIDMGMQNTHAAPRDANDLADLHTHGPSLRRLWQEGTRDADAKAGWEHIRAWGHHRPSAWEREDQRKRHGLAYSSPEMSGAVSFPLDWHSSGDPLFPWSAEVDGVPWQIRVNDFPDELMYSLIIDGTLAGDFHDWPETWGREEISSG